MSHYASGRRLEWKVRDYFIERGWTFLMRAAGSKGPFDLVMLSDDRRIVFIQVKSKSTKKQRQFKEAETLMGTCFCCAMPSSFTLFVTWPKRGDPIFSGTYWDTRLTAWKEQRVVIPRRVMR